MLSFGLSLCFSIPAQACFSENSNPIRLDKMLTAGLVFDGLLLDRKDIKQTNPANGKEYVRYAEFTFLVKNLVHGTFEDHIITVGLANQPSANPRKSKNDRYRVSAITPDQVALYCPEEAKDCGLSSAGGNLNRPRQIPFILSQNCTSPAMIPLNSMEKLEREGITYPPANLWKGYEAHSLAIEIALKEASVLSAKQMAEPAYRKKLEADIHMLTQDWERRRQAKLKNYYKPPSKEAYDRIVEMALNHLERLAKKLDFDPAYRQRFINYEPPKRRSED